MTGVLLGLVLAAVAALCQFPVRWLRWQFLTRRLGLSFHTRASLRTYAVAAPLLAVPVLGELLRPLTVTGREPRTRAAVLRTWVLEIALDVAAVATLVLLARGEALGAVASGVASWLLAGVLLIRSEARRGSPTPRRDGLVLAAAAYGASLIIWLLPALALLAVRAVTEAGGTTAVLITLAGLAVGFLGLGLGTLARGGRGLPLSADDSADHFDDLAPEYGEEIPEHMRQRLLRRKTDVMLHYFQSRGRDPHQLRGLDFGCGQGWYAVEMALSGFDMSGTDASRGQLEGALAHAQQQGTGLEIRQNEPGRIPFADESFDFVYAINVLHHVLDDADRETLFADLDRILKPGGVVFVHEMNTLNPLFRLYMSYLFPLVRRIDVGNERWINPRALPAIPGGSWVDVTYYTFVPDFVPQGVIRLLRPVEAALERSPLRYLSAHFTATYEKSGAAP